MNTTTRTYSAGELLDDLREYTGIAGIGIGYIGNLGRTDDRSWFLYVDGFRNGADHRHPTNKATIELGNTEAHVDNLAGVTGTQIGRLLAGARAVDVPNPLDYDGPPLRTAADVEAEAAPFVRLELDEGDLVSSSRSATAAELKVAATASSRSMTYTRDERGVWRADDGQVGTERDLRYAGIDELDGEPVGDWRRAKLTTDDPSGRAWVPTFLGTVRHTVRH